MLAPDVNYARSGDVAIAHQVIGDGDITSSSAARSRNRGIEVDTAGDGFFATFDGPARAVRCARAIQVEIAELGIRARAGVHTGECELIDGKPGGLAVVVGARISAAAAAGDVLVSGTVRDLVAGSGIAFADRGEHELKGVPGVWQLYAAESD